MGERENGQLPLAKPTVRNRISSERWEQIKTAYAAGIGLREIARTMDIPEGTILSHAKRHGWTQQIQAAQHALFCYACIPWQPLGRVCLFLCAFRCAAK
jgi:DNA-binding NarL/FixJ family response regulator